MELERQEARQFIAATGIQKSTATLILRVSKDYTASQHRKQQSTFSPL
jgi:hypothetical protein